MPLHLCFTAHRTMRIDYWVRPSTTTDEGLRVELRNMKGKTLRGIGFDESAVRFGQTVDVGFRTTDLAMRLGDSITGSITSVSIGNPLNTVNSHRGGSIAMCS